MWHNETQHDILNFNYVEIPQEDYLHFCNILSQQMCDVNRPTDP